MPIHFRSVSAQRVHASVLTVAFALAGCAGAGSPIAPFVSRDASPAARSAKPVAYKLLHLFRGGSDGANPYAGLTEVGGAFYGVTYGNRVGTCGGGTVFSVSPAGKERVLYCFKGTPDGAQPAGKLLAVGNTLYGTTFNGGAHALGTVFKISTLGDEHVVYSFAGGTDGTNPGSGLVEAGGKLYGTTVDSGGAETGDGTVFSVTTAGKETVLHTFKGAPSDGETPYASLVAIGKSLYGATQGGGATDFGSIFEIDTAGHERMIYSFKGPAGGEGAFPIGDLLDVHGVLYGTTSAAPGTIFKVTTTGVETVVHAFAGAPSDGSQPRSGLTELKGRLYGSTEFGGANGFGSIFSVTASGKERMLYSFKGAPKDGADPFGNLTAFNGALYGTTLTGGINAGGSNYPDAGSIFRIAP